MLKIIPDGFFFDFLSKAKVAGSVSLLVVLASVAIVAFMGLNYGIDFKGGTDMILKFEKPLDSDTVRAAAAEAGFPDANVQEFGSTGTQFLVQTSAIAIVDQAKIEALRPELAKVGTLKNLVWSDENPERMDLTFDGEVSNEAISAALTPLVGPVEVEIDTTGAEKRQIVRFEDLQSKVKEGFAKALPDTFNPGRGIERLETVGPRVGKQLRDSGVLSLVVALFLILAYIAFRFDLRYAPGAVLALAHDVAISVGVFSLIQMEITLPTIAALLTVVGYSLNDTIVIFDRIRESLADRGENEIEFTINQAISDTLSRTIMTSLTTLVAVGAIFVFGAGLIKDFAFALIVGIIVGTYSSVFIASPAMLFMHRYLATRRELKARTESVA